VIFQLEYATTIVQLQPVDKSDVVSYNGEQWIERGGSVELKCIGDGNPQPDLVITENQINVIASGPSEKIGAWTSNSFRKMIQKILFQIDDYKLTSLFIFLNFLHVLYRYQLQRSR